MWYVYILRCKDGSLYTGVTSDLKRRLSEHNSDNKRGSRFVRAHRPAVLAYKEVFPDKGNALKREAEIKGWRRDKKLKFISEHQPRRTKE